MKPNPKAISFTCDWCSSPATHKDWRELDGMTTSTLECDSCAALDTEYLRKRAKRGN